MDAVIRVVLGGLVSRRKVDAEDRFETAVEDALGKRVRADEQVAIALWSALANVTWRHAEAGGVGYSFRAAGDLVAAIRREGNYLNWYCSGPAAVVSAEIRDALAAEGWTPEVDP